MLCQTFVSEFEQALQAPHRTKNGYKKNTVKEMCLQSFGFGKLCHNKYQSVARDLRRTKNTTFSREMSGSNDAKVLLEIWVLRTEDSFY